MIGGIVLIEHSSTPIVLSYFIHRIWTQNEIDERIPDEVSFLVDSLTMTKYRIWSLTETALYSYTYIVYIKYYHAPCYIIHDVKLRCITYLCPLPLLHPTTRRSPNEIRRRSQERPKAEESPPHCVAKMEWPNRIAKDVEHKHLMILRIRRAPCALHRFNNKNENDSCTHLQ